MLNFNLSVRLVTYKTLFFVQLGIVNFLYGSRSGVDCEVGVDCDNIFLHLEFCIHFLLCICSFGCIIQ